MRKLLLLVLIALSLCAGLFDPLPAHATTYLPAAAGHVQGVTIQTDSSLRLDSAATRQVMVQAVTMGANTLVIQFPLEQVDVHATTITRRAPVAGTHRAYTPNDVELRGGIRNAYTAGFKAVVLKPTPEVRTGEWRAHITFTNRQNKAADRWAKAWGGWLVHFGKVAQAAHATGVCVGTEQFGVSLDRYNRHNTGRMIKFWIKPLRKVFHGQVTYAAFLGSWNRPHESLLLSRTFVHSLDSIGVNLYPRLVDYNHQPTPAEVAKADEGYRRDWLDKMRKRYGKATPVIVTETGFRSRTVADTFNDQSPQPDQNLQALQLDAVLTMLHRHGYGVWLFRIGNTAQAGGPADTGFTWQGKKAAQVVASHYRGRVPR